MFFKLTRRAAIFADLSKITFWTTAGEIAALHIHATSSIFAWIRYTVVNTLCTVFTRIIRSTCTIVIICKRIACSSILTWIRLTEISQAVFTNKTKCTVTGIISQCILTCSTIKTRIWLAIINVITTIVSIIAF